MRKLLAIVACVCCLSAGVWAQHQNMNETPIKTDLSLSSDVQFGPQVLKAGEYKVKCDREKITFLNADTGKMIFETKCQGQEMKEASIKTQLYVKTLPNGAKAVDHLVLKGSTIDHVF